MREQSTTGDARPSVLASLRSLVPERPLQFNEALRLAELQAVTLRRLCDMTEGPVSDDLITDLPRIRVVYRRLPTSGMSYWDGQEWVIAINSSEPLTRQRFTLLHEFKHVVDHGRTDRLYGTAKATADLRAEQACDYFAGCVLMPKQLMKRAWGNGIQQPEALAEHFDVSPRAAEVRLAQLGLSDPVDRCAASRRSRLSQGRRKTYYRLISNGWTHRSTAQVAA